MDNATLAIIVTAVLSVAALAWTMLGVKRLRGNRHLLQGAGAVLIPIGLWLTGIMELLVEGAKAIYRFFTDNPLDAMTIAGIIVGGLGVLLVLAALVVKPVTRAESKQRRLAARQSQPTGAPGGASKGAATPQVGRGPAAGSAAQKSGAPAPTTQTPAVAPKGGGKGLSDEDLEIEALLKKRGIE
ncbi:hypothetical protein ACQB6R_08430 [Propionibacteriaceae bacterium G1746]|uniref:hypothetical protein n=1 Tax=Aestuariimicrobium sp. G57 TaxID=3418485 RepID=UPI003C181D9D